VLSSWAIVEWYARKYQPAAVVWNVVVKRRHALGKLKSVLKMDKNKQKIILAIAITAFIVLGLCGMLIIKNNPTSQKHILLLQPITLGTR
jgi:quinol-cytochrome oxidoreductase complex cytochrome b subunit